MVRFVSFIVTALLASSAISAAPLVGRNRKQPQKNEPAAVNNTEVVASNVTNVDNSALPIAAGNVTACDSGLNATSPKVEAPGKGDAKKEKAAKKLAKGGKHHKNANATEPAALPPCPPLNVTSNVNVDNSTAPGAAGVAAAKPKAKPAEKVVGQGNPSVGDPNANAVAPPAANPKAKPATPQEEAGQGGPNVPAANQPKGGVAPPGGDVVARKIARSLFDIPRMSRGPKRRLTEVSQWK